jgi:hypothetical protein
MAVRQAAQQRQRLLIRLASSRSTRRKESIFATGQSDRLASVRLHLSPSR